MNSFEYQSAKSPEGLSQRILKYAELNFKKGTVDLFRISFEHLIACVGHRPLRIVTSMDAENLKEYLLARVKRMSANVYLRTLKAAFNTAIRLNFMEQSPFKNCRLLKVPVEEPAHIHKLISLDC